MQEVAEDRWAAVPRPPAQLDGRSSPLKGREVLGRLRQVSFYSIFKNRIKQKNICSASLQCYPVVSFNDFSLRLLVGGCSKL